MGARRTIITVVLGLLAAFALAAGDVHAATLSITVTTPSDTAPEAGGDCGTTDVSCTLREAFQTADDDGGATITLPAGSYTLQQGQLNANVPITLTGQGTGTTTISAANDSRVVDVGAGTFTASGITFTAGNASPSTTQGTDADDGGGLLVQSGATADLTNVVVSSSAATDQGAGIAVDGGNLTLLGSTVQSNVTANSGHGGGISIGGISGTNLVDIENTTISANDANFGGGIYELQPVSATTSVTLKDDAITGNQASDDGGGIYGDPNEKGSLNTTISDSTVSGNEADQGYGGGLLLFQTSGDSQGLLSDTIAANTAFDGGPDIEVTGQSGGTSPHVQDSIIGNGAASSASGCGGSYLVSLGHNLDATTGSGGGCGLHGPGDVTTTQPGLAALANNGGPTQTMALQPGSPAIDAGGTGCGSTDQRGVSAPQGAACDIGAYELAEPSVSGVSSSAVTASTASIAATVADPDAVPATITVSYGTSTAYGRTSSSQTASAFSVATAYSVPLAGLTPSTTYHYTVVATTPHGTATSSDGTFTTAAAPTGTQTNPTATVPTATVPSNRFTATKLAVTKKGVLSVRLAATDAGSFSAKATYRVSVKRVVKVHGKRTTKKVLVTETYGSSKLKVTKAGTKVLSLTITKAAAHELAKLKRTKVTLTISFTPTGGRVATKKLTITVKRAKTGRYS